MPKKFSFLLGLVTTVLFSAGLIMASTGPELTKISNATPSQAELVTITGIGLTPTTGSYSSVIYIKGTNPVEGDFHYPLTTKWTATEIEFKVGSGSGQSLVDGIDYTFNVFGNGDILTTGLDFKIGVGSSNNDVPMCKDSDDKNDIYKQGKATYGTEEKFDRCKDDQKSLIQVWCDGATIIAEKNSVSCLYGCEDGACLTDPKSEDEGVESGGEEEEASSPEEEGDSSVVFKDVPKSIWYADAVNFLKLKGIVSGYKDLKGNALGEYRPTRNVNIAESLKVVLNVSGKGEKVGGTSINSLAKIMAWPKEFFARAEEMKMRLFIDGKVDPASFATRGDIACMVTEALALKEVVPVKTFSDLSSTHPAYKCFGATSLIFKGDDKAGTMRPNSLINRAEFAVVMKRALDGK